jgi:cell shape-determining protein MreC
MKTTSRKRPSLGSVLAVLAAASLIVLAVVFRHGLTGMLWSAGAPLVRLRDSWSGSEVADLRAQLASTTAALADRNLLAGENMQLRQELGRTAGHKVLLAGVLQSPPGTPYDTLLLDAGSSLGVSAGQRVFAGNIAIGEVDAVYGDTSRAVLYSAPGRSYQALLTTQSAAVPVAVEGQGAGSMQAQVPQGTEAAVGDDIVFPGVAGGLAARVSAVSAPAGESFKTLYLRLPVNIFELRYVYIEQP